MQNMRFLIYGFDRSGMSHTARSLKIADHISRSFPGASILILTDLTIIGRLNLPNNVDYVHLPRIDYGSKSSLGSGNLLDLELSLKIRNKIARSAAKTFKPNMVIVDRNPEATPREMNRMLSFIRNRLPKTKIIWMLQDVLGDTDSVVRNWQKLELSFMLSRLCDEIWIGGTQSICDLNEAYQFSNDLCSKVKYTNYLSSIADPLTNQAPGTMGARPPTVLVTAGSGFGGFNLLNSYLDFIESRKRDISFESQLITGPMMASQEKSSLKRRAKSMAKVHLRHFTRDFSSRIENCDLVISTGGYNTFCDILSHRKRAIIVPETIPANGHLARAEIFSRLGCVEFIRPEELSAESLGDKALALIQEADQVPSSTSVPFKINGLDTIKERIRFHLESEGESTLESLVG